MRTDTEFVIAPKGSNVEADFYTRGQNDEAVINNALAMAAGSDSIVKLVAGARYVIDPTVGIQMKSGVTFDMARAVVTIADDTDANGNILKCESISNFRIRGCLIDGNRSGQASGTNYGLYVAGCSYFVIEDAESNQCRGVGNHFYNNTRGQFGRIVGSGNLYHGAEIEQCVLSAFDTIIGHDNDQNGVLVSPGEVDGTGTRYCTFANIIATDNDAYGYAQNAANDDVSAWLNESNVHQNVICSGNAGYGLNLYKQDKQVFGNVACENNGLMGIYLYQSQYNVFSNVALHNNSALTDGAYDEIMVEGDTGHYSTHNQFRGGFILIDGDGTEVNRARYGINEASADDGDNVFDVVVINAGTSGRTNIQSGTTIPPATPGILMINPLETHAMPAGGAGIDNAFTDVMRIINLMGGQTQLVNEEAAFTAWIGGAKRMGIETNGSFNLFAPATTQDPTDAQMFAFWLDEAANMLKVRVKYADGTTVKAGSISLA